MRTRHAERPPASRIEVIPAAPEQQTVLANLLELYAHDFSEFHDIELGTNGRFGYARLPLYWSEPGRHPFLVQADGKLPGLVLVKSAQAARPGAVRQRNSRFPTPGTRSVVRGFPKSKHRPRFRATRRKRNFNGLGRGSRVRCAAKFLRRGSEISGTETVWDMAEFFVVRRYRRLGIGTEIAHQVWKRFPGAWEIRVLLSNRPAHRFWERAISRFTGETIRSVPIERRGEQWRLFSFESKRSESG